MFSFLNKQERKEKLLKNTQAILEADVIRAKRKEILVGIDPETLLGSEIFRLSRETLALKSEVKDLNNKMAELIHHLENDKI